jgi:hypothetical protein
MVRKSVLEKAPELRQMCEASSAVPAVSNTNKKGSPACLWRLGSLYSSQR